MDFLFVELNDNHYHSLKNLLVNYRIPTNNSVPLLADHISKNQQFGVATVQDVEEDSEGDFETVFSLITIVPLLSPCKSKGPKECPQPFLNSIRNYFV